MNTYYFSLQTLKSTTMRSFIIFAFGLAMVLALVESSPMNNIEDEGEDLLMAEDIESESKSKSIWKKNIF